MNKKHIADSILEGITIEDELILELYNSKELKRLSRISHLGLVHFLYPMAKHYRFEHSLGVYELTRRTLKKLNPKVPKSTYRAVLAAGLLHDLGHGPFSHLFESVSVKDHEEYSIDIINDKSTDIYKAFQKIEPKARNQVIQILRGEHPLPWCNQLISSEVDMDRLDYLLRDSASTGASYGKIDWRWLIKNAMILKDTNELVFKEKALSVIESLLLGRYHMNIAIYWNPKNVANTMLYKFWFKRMIYLFKEKKLTNFYTYLTPVLEEREMTVEEFLILDDSIVQSAIRYSTQEEDKYLVKIAEMFLKQEMPKRIFGEKEVVDFVKKQDKKLKEQTWTVIDLDPNFSTYQKEQKFPAKIISNDGKVHVATKYSTVINHSGKKQNMVKKLAVYI